MAHVPRGRATDLAGVAIRRAERRDRHAILRAWGALLRHHQHFHASYRGTSGPTRSRALERTLDAAWSDADHEIWLAEDAASDGCLGFCATSRFDPGADAAPIRGTIEELWVDRDARRAGVGTALAEAALASLRSRGARRFEVRVLLRNRVALAFWERLGFTAYASQLELVEGD